MASLRKLKNTYYVRFRLAGKQFERDVGMNESVALATKKRVEATLLDIGIGRIKIPADADITQFVISDGQATAKPGPPDVLTVADLFRRYNDALPEGAMEPNTLTTHRIHRNHLTRLFGANHSLHGIGTPEFQAFIDTEQEKRASFGREDGASRRCQGPIVAPARTTNGLGPRCFLGRAGARFGMWRELGPAADAVCLRVARLRVWPAGSPPNGSLRLRCCRDRMTSAHSWARR